MKVSEVTNKEVIEYLRLEHEDLTEEEITEINNILIAAKKFIKSYTGLTEEQIDTHEDFYIVVMVLCQDMYDNRSMYIDKNNLNKVVDTILGMHSMNLL
ncbi:head-tail connector protein [Alkaliphilus sp. B6464]|uniref:head-tail connector protein n=1 Tax=Alkaliphilus sp. B6464 TaxID=2731219 RepID=UPI001BA8BAD6|nr:head-tail connector protein [Alkaliphilus sp. B6464]QUH21082.1 phage gp6-like head-tail connector protein [Alkaliphilus sp. B6464]